MLHHFQFVQNAKVRQLLVQTLTPCMYCLLWACRIERFTGGKKIRSTVEITAASKYLSLTEGLQDSRLSISQAASICCTFHTVSPSTSRQLSLNAKCVIKRYVNNTQPNSFFNATKCLIFLWAEHRQKKFSNCWVTGGILVISSRESRRASC